MVAGTVASEVSLLVRSTTRELVVSVLRLTVAVVAPAPAPSEIEAATMLTVKAAMSSSVTSTVSLPLAWSAALAVRVTV